jgi:hypothetical protein
VLLLVFLIVGFFWLVVGALQYLVCVAIPRLRRYALSAALWWAAWGPCSIALMILAGVGVLAGDYFTKGGDISRLHFAHPAAALWWGYLVLGVLGTATIATAAAWMHQAIVRRFPFPLFRLYVTAVSGGIGSVFGWCFGGWVLGKQLRYGWILGGAGMLILVAGFALVAYRGARSLRGTASK